MDPINQISESPEILNPSPQSPEKSKSSNSLTIISMAIFILMSLGVIVFLYYQNQQLKSMLESYQTQSSPTPTATTDPTVNWKTYTNSYWGVSIKYPQDKLTPCPNYATEAEGIRFFSFGFDCPNGTDVVYKIGLVGYKPGVYKENKKPTTTEQIMVDGKTATKNTYTYNESDGPLFAQKESQEIVLALSKGTITLQQWGNNVGDKQIFNQILSTFKVITATSSASPVPTQKACTLEAKICPDGSSVGRTGPNCEFAPCPQ
jgi:hypothetical protein